MPRAEWLLQAEAELEALARTDQIAIARAAAKLEALGSRLSLPHQSSVRGAEELRELRPKAGQSPWRVFYRCIGPELFKIGAVGPEYSVNRKGFQRSVSLAEERLSGCEEYRGG